ncbi:MAG TPA: glycosyltransferase [Azospirillum sp.]
MAFAPDQTLWADARPPEAPAPQRPLRVLSFTTVYPQPGNPVHGLFVQERLRHLSGRADIRVVAPVAAWHRRRGAGEDAFEALPVLRPAFHYVPGVLKGLDGALLALSALPAVRRLRRGFDFDVIDAHFTYPDGFAAVLLGAWFGRPVTITERGTLIPLSADPVRRRLADWALHRADRTIAVAANLAERIRACGVPAERCTVIENGVDADRFRPLDRAAARARAGCPHGGRLLVSVGHLSMRKGFHRLIAVLPRLLDRFPDLALAIVGGPGAEGDARARLERRAAELGVSGRVLFAGAQPPDGVAAWLAAGDLFALATDYEGCPNVVWEAMACARPVVVTRVGHVAHMVPPFAGLLCDRPDDADEWTRRIADALDRDWDRARIRRHAEAHTWDRVADRVLREWRLAVADHQQRPEPKP